MPGWAAHSQGAGHECVKKRVSGPGGRVVGKERPVERKPKASGRLSGRKGVRKVKPGPGTHPNCFPQGLGNDWRIPWKQSRSESKSQQVPCEVVGCRLCFAGQPGVLTYSLHKLGIWKSLELCRWGHMSHHKFCANISPSTTCPGPSCVLFPHQPLLP